MATNPSNGRLTRTAVVCAAPSLGLVLVETVQGNGYAVIEVSERGLAAVAATGKHHPDVAVIDVAVAGAVGIEIVSLIRTLAPETEIIAIVPFPELRDSLISLGAGAVLVDSDLRLLPGILREVHRPAPSRVGSVMTNRPPPPPPLSR